MHHKHNHVNDDVTKPPFFSSSGCTCCKKRDTDELYTLSPNEHKDPSGLGHRPISVISNDHRVNSRSDSANATRSAAHTAQNPPEYYDLPEINWNAKDDQNSGVTNRDSERVSSSKQASPRPHYKEDRRRNRSELGSRAKKRERTDPASGSLRASDADLTGGGETQYRAESDERKFTPLEFTPLEREYRRYKREPESSQDDKVRVGDNERTRTNVTLEHEYRGYNSEPKSWQDNEVRSWDNGRTRIKERREASALSDRSKRSRAHRLLPAGEDNVAFNTESTETTV